MRSTRRFGTLIEADPEIERTLHRRRRQLLQGAREPQQPVPIMAARDENRPLKDYAAPNARGLRSGIARPTIEAGHFTIPPALLSMIRQNQFGGLPSEDPNDHVDMFLELCETLRIEGASVDAIRLRLFPLSLRDRAKTWLKYVPAETITTWDQLEQAFLDKFFPPSKTAHLRTQITGFIQRDGESLSEA